MRCRFVEDPRIVIGLFTHGLATRLGNEVLKSCPSEVDEAYRIVEHMERPGDDDHSDRPGPVHPLHDDYHPIPASTWWREQLDYPDHLSGICPTPPGRDDRFVPPHDRRRPSAHHLFQVSGQGTPGQPVPVFKPAHRVRGRCPGLYSGRRRLGG